jgi:hypothetical protein
MVGVFERKRSDCAGQVIQNVRKEPVVKVHVNRFTNIGIARAVQRQRPNNEREGSAQSGRPARLHCLEA